MEGEKNGKPHFLMDDLEEKTHYFRKHSYTYKTLHLEDGMPGLGYVVRIIPVYKLVLGYLEDHPS